MEAALVFPILIFLTFGCIEFGHYFFVSHTMQGAAREGARAAIVPGNTNTDVSNAVANAMSAAGMGSSGYTVEILNGNNNGAISVDSASSGTPVLVRVSANWGSVGLRPMGLIGAGKSVRGQTVMRRE